MSVTVAVYVLVLLGFSSPIHAVATEQDSSTDLTDLKSRQKRQVGDDLCYIPEPLQNGMYYPHVRRCPPGDNSAACRLVPGTQVSVGWVIRYSCDVTYQLSNTRIASICLHRPGGARWLPALPTCLESSYNSRFLPTKHTCGIPSRHLQSKRIKRKVDGKISARGAWPWMVIFGHSKSSNPRDGFHWFCAGTLVTTRHILTAANCVATHRRRPVFIARLGDLNLDDSVKDGAEPLEVGIEKKNIIVYPGFDPDTVFSKNIAVIKLKNDIVVTDFVRPICLPTPDIKNRTFTGGTVFFASWGQTDDDRERHPKRKRRFEPILHEITAKIIDHEVCNKNYRLYQSSDTPIIISDKLICASAYVNKSCQGDIGSPLMLEDNGRFFLLGIVATSYRCFDDNFPRLFTKLSMYMEDWVVPNLKF